MNHEHPLIRVFFVPSHIPLGEIYRHCAERGVYCAVSDEKRKKIKIVLKKVNFENNLFTDSFFDVVELQTVVNEIKILFS